jgi:hypothetical protein
MRTSKLMLILSQFAVRPHAADPIAARPQENQSKRAYSISGIATFFLMGVSAVAQNYTVTDLGLLPRETLPGVGNRLIGASGRLYSLLKKWHCNRRSSLSG